MACLPQKALSTRCRVVAVLVTFVGLTLYSISYFHSTWAKFTHKGKSGSLGLHTMCIDDTDGTRDCRDITGKDFPFYLFQGFSAIGLLSFLLFFVTACMTFSSCIKSPKAICATKSSVVLFDLVTINCLMVAIATGLKTSFLGTLRMSYGSFMCIVAFSFAILLCPVYLTDARNTAKHFKEYKHEKFSDIQEPTEISDSVNEHQMTERGAIMGIKYRTTKA